jgi:methylmalonyl-CoA/ethylmalonyl-CoA epimerase
LIRIHHIGYVVRDLDAFAASMPGLTQIADVVDPLQHARLALYTAGDGSMIELIQPENKQAFTWAHLERSGEGLHHICYEGIAADAIDGLLRRHRLMRIRGPIPAVLFGRDVLFAVSRQKAIIEFLL